jgi:branched-chain amino acid transport system ATP-binding protein
MLAIGRALMSKPKLLCIDEPSTGLSPIMRAEVFRKISEIKDMGITVLLVEQEVSTVFKMTERNYVLVVRQNYRRRVGGKVAPG